MKGGPESDVSTARTGAVKWVAILLLGGMSVVAAVAIALDKFLDS